MTNARAEPSAKRTVLVVDDEPQLVEVLRAYLTDEGFEVIEAANGRDAIARAREHKPDLVLLDLNLPSVSGIEAFRAMRVERDVPIVMLTSRVAEVDRIVGLELGADDYITKPYSPREVVARVKAVLRRARPRDASDRTVRLVGEIEIDVAAHEVRRRGSVVALTPMEFRILTTLAANAGCAMTRERILESASADGDAFDRTLDRHVANLRSKIEDEPARPRLIVTVVGIGYKLVDPARGAASPRVPAAF